MKNSPKNYLFLNKGVYLLPTFFFLLSFSYKAQVGNYINNGSFEERYHCNGPGYHVSLAKYWNSIDSSIFTPAGGYRSICNAKVPYNGSGFQYPRTGNAYILTSLYCLLPNCGRGYLKNRLKANLKAGSKYCVTFHVSIANESPRGMDGFGIYFGDNSMDSITKCTIPLSYINPQVKNPIGNVISDTLNWTAITGTFIATGTEKYALIGNFLADNAVTTSSINTPYYPQYWTDVYVDDVSCIEVNVPAYAGSDKSIVPGDSTFIGRQPDFATDAGCTWYKLPNMVTPINTISGLWVKPTVTSTYVVRQILDCSSEKWDTVVIYMNPVGLERLKILNEGLKLFPVPAKDYIEVSFFNEELIKDFSSLSIYNNLGVLIRNEEISFKKKSTKIELENLPEGVYFLKLKSGSNETISKRFVITW